MKNKRVATKLLILFCFISTIIPTTSALTHTQSVDCILVHNSQCGSCEDRYNQEVISFYEKYHLDERINFKIYDIADLEEQDFFLNEVDRLGIDLSIYGDLPYVLFIWENSIQVFDASNLDSIDKSFQNISIDFNEISPSSQQNESISLLDFIPTFNYPILFLAIVIVTAGVLFIQKGYGLYLKRGGSFIYPRRISPIRFKAILALSLLSISLLLYQFLDRLIGGCGCASGDIVQTLLFQKYDHIIISGYEIPIALIGILLNLSAISLVILLGAIRVHQKSRRNIRIIKTLYTILTGQMLLALLSLIYLVYLELFVIHFICTLCTVSQIIIGINTILIITWQPWKFNEKNLKISTKRVLRLPLIHPRVKRKIFQSFSFSIVIFVILTSVAPIGIPTTQTTSITTWNMPDFSSQFNSDICFECNNPMYIDTQGPLSVQSQNPVYSQINEILTKKPVFIFFYAEWCGFCKKQKPILMELREEYSDRIEFLYINADENPQMMQDFGVTGFPTMFLIDKNDNGYSYRVFRGFNEKNALADYFDFGYVGVSVDKAKQIIDRNKNAIILDVRTPSEYETVHLNDSTLIPLAHLESKMDEIGKEDFIVVYCKSGGRSQEASSILKENGFLYVHNIEGGIEAWQEAGFPVVPETEVSVRFSTEAETCNSNLDCNTGEYCAKSTGDCTGTGICKPKLSSCPDVWMPVCGCDGVTYGSTCEAASAGENVAYEGECVITAGESVVYQECLTDADCDSPFICRKGVCSDCVDDTDCGAGFICMSGVCTTYECVDDSDCDSPFICKGGVCITFECADKDCDDGQYCNGAEVCVAGVCEPGSPVDCNDGISCTVDQCNEMTDSCENQPDDTRCDNGQFCDGIETCDALLDCQAGNPLDCSDFDDQCNVGICDEVNDQCVANPDPYVGQPCDDGDPYTIGDTCSAGVCIGESVQCVSDSDCDDGQYCNGVEVCVAGVCEPGLPVDCNDGISCTVDQCNEMTDSCENQPDDTRCDNGQFCDGVETCDALLDCQAGVLMDCSAYDDQCNMGICDEASDQCVTDPYPKEGISCDDGDACTIGDTCQLGVCSGILDETDSDEDGILDCTDPCPNDPYNDIDQDGVCADIDNCPSTANSDQTDSDNDGLGDICDLCPNDPLNDIDGDWVCGDVDNCPSVSNSAQTDTDTDGVGNVCDNCPIVSNSAQADTDTDGVGNVCDNCPSVLNSAQADTDTDGVGNVCDNCPSDFNPDQADSDGDGIGDICENAPPIAESGGPYSGDEGTIITFNASSSSDPDGDELYYRWDFDNDGTWDTDYSSEPTIMHVWYDDYTGTIVLEVFDGEKTNTASTTISISNVSPDAFIDLILPEFFVLPGDTILFIGSFTDPGTLDTHTIVWDFNDSSIISDNLELAHVYLQPGTYNVLLTITDDDGGIGTKNVVVEVVSLQEALEAIKEIIDSFETCHKLKKIFKIHLELAIKFLNKADRFRANGKEKLAFIMQWVAKLQLRIFKKMVYIFERKEWITIDMAELLIAMTNRIIPKLSF